MTPAEIRDKIAENPKARARDLAQTLGITEVELVAARVGQGVTRIDATPDRLVPLVQALGPVMALTRNEACVAERVGVYTDYHGGPHAAMLLGEEIDMRIFPQHWLYGFALAEPVELPGGEAGIKRSIQIFDAAGDAVHKIHLRPESDVAAFDALVAELALPEQDAALSLERRAPVEPARMAPDKLEILRKEWEAMTDTHQFLRLVKKVKMNRLGAYRSIGAPQAQALPLDAVTQLLHRAAEAKVQLMIFVGNAGCIQIYGGQVERIVPMGPWINILDPGHDMHLRTDKIAEVWLVNKPTQRGDAISVEAFDAEGGLILQVFGRRSAGSTEAWDALAQGLLPEAAR